MPVLRLDPWSSVATCLAAVAAPASAQGGDHDALPIRSLPSGPGALAVNVSSRGDRVVVSWLEPAGGGLALRYVRPGPEGSPPPATVHRASRMFANWADLPLVVEGPGRRLLAGWLERSGGAGFAYGVRLALSEDDGRTWRNLGAPHRDGSPTEHGFLSIVPDDRGFYVIWLDGRELVRPRGRMSLRGAPVLSDIGPEETLDDDVCTCCQTAAVRTSRGLLVAYRDRSSEDVRDIALLERSGADWSAPRIPCADGWKIGGCPVNGPAMDAAGDRVALAWFTAAGGKARVRVALSRDGGTTFSEPVLVDARRPLGRVAVAVTHDGALVAWLANDENEAVLRVRPVAGTGHPGPARDVARLPTTRRTGFPRMARAGEHAVLVWRAHGQRAGLRYLRLPLFPGSRDEGDKRDKRDG